MGHLFLRWLMAIMIASNQLGNALTGGNPQESISSRAGEAREHGSKVGTGICAVFEAFDFHDPDRADHCTLAIEQHRKRLQQNLDKS